MSTLHSALAITMIVARGTLAGLAILRGTPSSIAFGMIGLLAVGTSVIAINRGKMDSTIRGAAISFGYLSTLLLVPGFMGQPWESVFWIGVFCDLLVKSQFMERTTVTSPVWISLYDRGAYGIIRHPMTLAELGILVGVVGGSPTAWNIACGLLILAIKVWTIWAEERFLMNFPQYAEYTKQVKQKLIPKIW